MKQLKTINLSITGLGFIIYSPFAVAHIAEGEDYFSNHHMYADQIVEHTNKGTIVDIATGTPGDFILHLFQGIPDYQETDEQRIMLQLGLKVRSCEVHIRDVYDLMAWTRQPPSEQVVTLEDGFYSLIVDSRRPESGVWGDYQVVNMYFEPTFELPIFDYNDFPLLYKEEHMDIRASQPSSIPIDTNLHKNHWARLKQFWQSLGK